ncbi:dual 3',5'-cyclic-AMP and -GMP phosphodiesterase 11-like isoform X2 [Cotesia glomerata]|nr:dual 3',5'-cyclic-AMP and -GMP phosphodiesterase 11-like isoform X2 [Cotesia glomerata]XP_044579340.1 dual 3',5'-cyclic-AMP and -GMP phosphodiesterase 11-like isoform X2 [Cotesia glomerata]XP_044579351.1 dual 3',5'-cyclic-AMP and -GMP phosphodiesterase 11-like isoform X2 [Cotesia glomerata]XP_044579359.1 dual 3',5'-cyclic-AMP and -GMP phosphodiesterase 11-like isoform X2 [Cotesia glomerata]XP_044579368.1 dual 3',5'-cyclic-AMP and -GMP phosphodiesterase 11-like isoform X2 [Cotesia glomerata]
MTAETAAPCVQSVQSVPSGVMVDETSGIDQQNHHQQQHHHQKSLINNVSSNNTSPTNRPVLSPGFPNSSSNPPEYNPEYASMESWLDEHPDFVNDYFLRKVTRQTVDAWLVMHATPTASSASCMMDGMMSGQNHCSQNSNACNNAGSTTVTSPGGGSGATTPVRKISAHEFERGGLLKPIVNTIDGTPTFLSIAPEDSGQTGAGQQSGGTSGAVRPQRKSRNELRQLDERDLIFELVKDICNELDVRSLCHKILQNVSMLLHADRGSLFLVQGERKCAADSNLRSDNFNPLISGSFNNNNNNSTSKNNNNNNNNNNKNKIPGKSKSSDESVSDNLSPPKLTRPRSRCLVSKLFDVCSRSTLVEMEKNDEIKIPWGTGIVGFVAESGEPVNIPDAYMDDRFNREIDVLTGYRTKALLCMPIKDCSGDVIGVAQVINKLGGEAQFTVQDEKIFASYLQFCGIGLKNAQLYEKSQLEVKRNQVLLDLARMIFEEQSTIEHMVFRILTHTQSLIQCQRVQVLLVHKASKGSFSRVFDFEANDLTGDDTDSRTSPFESRFPINIGITGYVATTGETVNIANAYEDSRFDPSVDDGTGFRHRTILCMPIKNSSGQIIGVIQLVNKFDDLLFTKNDENFVEAFAIFCGMGIHNTHMYETAITAMAKQSVTLEVLSYHASASIEDAQRLKSLRVPSSAYFHLHDFKFDDILMEDDDTLTACLRMFLDLDFVERFHIDYDVLCRWLLSVKKNYRNVTYHNWRHAFNVAQMMFAILTATQWWKIFGEIECLALIIACLCHDLDHRGTNNSFQIKASSPLAQLYSTSTMEHHHFDQCLMILSSLGNQILSNVSPDEYSRIVKVLEDAILSTDLAVYFRKRGAFFSIARGQTYNWALTEHRELLRGMLMTVCDLAAITKPWEIEKRVAELVSSEFFEQGDIERRTLNITPIDIMNREKEDQLPLMQVGFIDSICLPIYEAFALLSDKLNPLMEGVTENKKKWLELAESTCTSGNCTNHDRTSIDQPDKQDDKHENIVVE